VRFSNKNGLAVPCCQTHKYCSMLCQFLAVYKLYQGTRTLHKRNSLKQNKQTQSQMKTTITSLNPTVTFQESARTMQVDLVERVFQKTMLIRGIQTHRTTMGWVLYHPIGKRLTPTKANRISSIITQERHTGWTPGCRGSKNRDLKTATKANFLLVGNALTTLTTVPTTLTMSIEELSMKTLSWSLRRRTSQPMRS